MLLKQTHVVEDANELQFVGNTVDVAVKGAASQGPGIDVVPALFGVGLVQGHEQTGLGQNAGKARPQIVVEEVRAGSGTERSADHIPHGRRSVAFPHHFNSVLAVVETGHQGIHLVRYVGELVPEQNLDLLGSFLHYRDAGCQQQGGSHAQYRQQP